MGKARLKMELITKEKARNNTFHTKKTMVMKKVGELATLCGIKAIAIIFGPKQDTTQACPLEPAIFPDNHDEVLELINKYKGQSYEDRRNKTTLLSDVFKGMIKKCEKDITTLRSTNLQSKYPTGISSFSSFAENDLRRIVASLENTVKNAKAKLGQIKGYAHSKNVDCAYFQLQQQQQQMVLTKKRSMYFEEENRAAKYRVTIDPHQESSVMPVPMPIEQLEFPFMDHYQNQIIVNSDDDYVGGASNIVYDAHSSQSLYNCWTVPGTVQNIAYMNNYNGEGLQPTMEQLMKFYPIGPRSAPNQGVETYRQDDTYDQFYPDHAYDQFYQDSNW